MELIVLVPWETHSGTMTSLCCGTRTMSRKKVLSTGLLGRTLGREGLSTLPSSSDRLSDSTSPAGKVCRD